VKKAIVWALSLFVSVGLIGAMAAIFLKDIAVEQTLLLWVIVALILLGKEAG
jgi:hypothetical protein